MVIFWQHVAAWMNDIPTLVLLLFNGASVMSRDAFGRIALHYAAMRGLDDVVNLLLIDPTEEHDQGNINNTDVSRSNTLKQLKCKDKDGFTPWMLATSRPAINSTATLLRSAMLRFGLQVNTSTHSSFNHNSATSPNTIDTRDSSTLSKSEFRRVYFQRQRPVAIINHLFAGEKVWAFRELEAFLHRYGDVSVKTTGLPGSPSGQLGQLYVSTFLNFCFSPQQCTSHFTDESCVQGMVGTLIPTIVDAAIEKNFEFCDKVVEGNFIQLDSNNNNMIGEDILTPELFRCCYQSDNELIRLTIGSDHSSLIPTWQQGNASWSLVFVGKTIWFLAPPGSIYSI